MRFVQSETAGLANWKARGPGILAFARLDETAHPLPRMSRFVFISLVLFVQCATAAVDPAASGKAVADLATWLNATGEKAPLDKAGFASVPLTKADAERARTILWDAHAARIRAERAAEVKAKVIELNGLKMKFDTLSFGDPAHPPAGGRSLFISMHGGGGAPAAVNESQWENQVRLGKGYRPEEGIYLAPRAPTDSWNMWHQAHIDSFFDRLIEDFVVLENVNPNRVYILGYSAGGDGVYQLGPRMADRLAAAAMMAGHPNSACPFGLRNIGFCIQVGANDDGYGRNKVAEKWGKRLDDLAKADPGGYAHFTELHAGKGHWMDMADRKAIPWMEKFTRNPIPEKIAWHQDGVIHPSFYWLAVEKENAHAGDEITAERHAQAITLTGQGPAALTVRLNDAMLDLDQPVTITWEGKQVFAGLAPRTIATLASTCETRGDPGLTFSAEVKVNR